MPFPFYNRILTVKANQHISSNRYVTNSIAIPPITTNKKLVAVPFFKSQWIVEENSPSILTIQYTANTDPGGYIPPWLSNLAIDVGPYNTIKALKDNVERIR
jgi:hypothetical protein